jgi:hypothetical protein
MAGEYLGQPLEPLSLEIWIVGDHLHPRPCLGAAGEDREAGVIVAVVRISHPDCTHTAAAEVMNVAVRQDP